MEDNSYQLIISYFEKTITDEGLNELQEWIEASPANLSQFSETIHILEASKSYFKPPLNPEKAWAKVQGHISREEIPTPVTKRRWMPYMAACLICYIMGAIIYRYGAPAGDEYLLLSNTDGKPAKYVLPDHSLVYLGGGSKLKYPRHFDGKTRKIELDGEAFFDVVHQPDRPFTVSTGDIVTVVLGTSFNIKAYGKEEQIAVTVKTGKVAVMAQSKGRNELIRYLLPDDQISINPGNGLYTYNKTDANEVISWINRDFIFYNTALKDIAMSLEHHYGVEIQFTDPELSKIRLTARFKNISLTETMDNLTILSGLAFTQNGKHLYISNNNQKGGKIME
jgi:transmembrane sensor